MILSTGYTSLDITVVALAFVFVFHLVTRVRVPKGLRLPPGPPGKPIVGNAGDMPRQHGWLTFDQWAKRYGGLVYIEVFNQSMMFVNSMDITYDLLEKRSSLYSDRPRSPMLNELMGFDQWNWALFSYGERWRKHRKVFYQNFHPAAATAYYPIQIKQTRSLLRRLHASPDDFIAHSHLHAGALIVELAYGLEVLPEGDPYLATAEKVMSSITEAGTPGAFLVDSLPLLKYLPEWLPGAGFKRKARIWRGPITEVAGVPFMTVKRTLADGTAKPSLTASLLEKLSPDASTDEQEVIRNVGGAAYVAGSDTTHIALTWFFLAMILYPEVQRKAQAELDSVIGTDRLPIFEDRDQLPYVNALCKEIHRWHPVVPLGVAHQVTQDDVYGDYFIPGGTIIVANAWTMLHDENLFGPNTEEFAPERFLKPGVKDPTIAFGFGRRICPGRHMADNTIFITVASILKVFNITHARDKSGKKINVEASSTSGTLARPEPFQCSIKSRSTSAEGLILEPVDD